MNGRERVAQKEHRCNWLCHGIIRTGERYWDERIGPPDHSDNETWDIWRAHLDCRDAWLELGDLVDWHFPGATFEWLDILYEERHVDHNEKTRALIAKAIERCAEAGWRVDESEEGAA